MDRFYIGPYDKNSGLRNDVKPMVIPEEAFSELTNAYIFRGRVRKRFGSRWLSNTQLGTRLRVNIAVSDGTGIFNTFVPRNSVSNTPIATPAIGQLFSVATEVFTVVSLGVAQPMLRSGASTLATFDTTNGNVVINGASMVGDLYYYPALPVMGLLSAETTTRNNEPTYAFDTRFAYQYINGGWERLNGEVGGQLNVAYWLGSNSQFFWGTTWTGANASDKIFFVTNFNTGERSANHLYNMRYLTPALVWNDFTPQIDQVAGPTNIYLFQALILVPFKNRLLAFNTWEGAVAAYPGTQYSNRVRYSQIGDPTDLANGWRQDIPGKGNAIDAPTTEAITTIEFVKDRLIVFFERSTWELVYTGNQAYPFAWQQINTELGAESTFSIVPFDKVAIGVGNVGIHACNGANVERIDSSIPDLVFSIHNDDNGVQRVYGVRDYYVEMIYWTYPDATDSATYPYPNKVLVYNYKTGTWGINVDSITVFGYFQPSVGILWSSTTVFFSSSLVWGAGPAIAKFRQVIAGNQEGFTFLITADDWINSENLQITNLTVANNTVTLTVIDHNLNNDSLTDTQFVFLTLLNQMIFKIIPSTITANTFQIEYIGAILAGTYLGNGTLASVSKIDIYTKEYNFYANQGRNAAVQKVDFLVDATAGGQVIVDMYTSSSVEPLIPQSGDALLGTSVLETSAYPTIPYEAQQERLWHPVYFQAEGEYIQFEITQTDSQMLDELVRIADFQLHAIIITAQPSSQRLS